MVTLVYNCSSFVMFLTFSYKGVFALKEWDRTKRNLLEEGRPFQHLSDPKKGNDTSVQISYLMFFFGQFQKGDPV